MRPCKSRQAHGLRTGGAVPRVPVGGNRRQQGKRGDKSGVQAGTEGSQAKRVLERCEHADYQPDAGCNERSQQGARVDKVHAIRRLSQADPPSGFGLNELLGALLVCWPWKLLAVRW